MAKSRKTTEQADDPGNPQQQAERMARNLGGSAHQIWLAGVGAFGRAQVEGGKLFENLVKEGASMEGHARRFADNQAAAAKTVIESSVDNARHQATGTWERLEKSFEERVRRTMDKYGVPAREDLADLRHRVDDLTEALRKRDTAGAPGRKTATPRTPAGKKSTRPRAPSPAKSTRRKTGAKASVSTEAKPTKAATRKRAGKTSAPNG